MGYLPAIVGWEFDPARLSLSLLLLSLFLPDPPL